MVKKHNTFKGRLGCLRYAAATTLQMNAYNELNKKHVTCIFNENHCIYCKTPIKSKSVDHIFNLISNKDINNYLTETPWNTSKGKKDVFVWIQKFNNNNLYYKIKYIVKNIPIIPESYFKKMKIKYDFVMKLANIIDIILNTPMNEFENEEELKNILFHECQIL